MAGRRWIDALLLAAIAMLVGCGGCGGQPDYCKGLELTAAEGQPLDLVPIALDLEVPDGEEPPVVGQLYAEVKGKGIDGPYYTPIEQDAESEQYSLVVPAHPEGIAGGGVKLKIHGTDGACGGWEKFDILPLDPAPGTMEKVLDGLERVIALQTEKLGYEMADLDTDDPSDLPEALWGHVAYFGGIDGDSNPNSLRAIANNDAEVDVSEGLELANALMAKANVPERLEEAANTLETIEPPEDMLEFGMDQAFRTRRQALVCDELLIYPRIGGPGALSYYMKVADGARSQLATGDAARLDTAGSMLGLVPHPAAKAAAIVLSTLAFHKKATALAYSNTLPSTIVNPEVEVTKKWFEEDSEETGTWRDEYKVSATSNGWDATGTILEGLVQAIDNAIGSKGLVDELSTGLASGDLAGDLATVAASNGSKAFLNRFEGGCSIPQRTWGPINVSDSIWSEVEYELAIEGRGDRWSYAPEDTGRGTITLNVPPAAFPPASNKLASLLIEDIEVREINVSLDPGYDRIEPGDTLEVTARVTNAKDKGVKWTLISPLNAGASVEETGVDADGNETAIVTGPSDPEKYPVRIKAKSIAIGGARTASSPERADFGIYNVDEEVIISPSFKCVKPGETQDYEAVIAGSDDKTLEWTATGGRISGSTDEATYTGSENGLFTIEATHEGMGVSDTATVVVNKCECEYDVLVQGADFAQFGQHIGLQAATNGNSLTMTFTHPDGHGAQINSLAQSGMGVNPGVPGEYIAAGSVSLAGTQHIAESYFVLGGDEPQDEGWGRLTIDEWDLDEKYFSGRFVGRAILLATVGLPEDEQVWVDITITFRSFVTEVTDILGIANGANCDIATND